MRFSGKELHGSVTIIYENGERKTREIGPAGREMVWQDGNERIAGAYVQKDGKLLLDTGEQAENLFWKTMEKKRTQRNKTEPPESLKKNKKSDSEKKGLSEKRDEDQTQKPDDKNAETSLMHQSSEESMFMKKQRRWPPPVLMRQAVYRAGTWREE